MAAHEYLAGTWRRSAGLLVLLAAPALGTGADLAQRWGWEIVTVEGRELPRDVHVSVHTLSLVRVKDGGSPEPIPFQVDERDRGGQFALPHGREPSRDNTPEVVDDNDLLVFRARDVGEHANVPDAVEIRVVDRQTGADGWVYLRHATSPANESGDVRYDAERDVIYARRYTLQFQPHTTTFFAFNRADGVPGRNLLDRVKARITATFLGGVFTFHRDENDVTSTVIAWKDGPVRMIRRTRIRVRVGYGLPQPEVVSENIFTGEVFEAPATVHIPFDLRYVLGALTLRTYMDFDNLHGFRIFAPGVDPVSIGCDDAPVAVNGQESDWFGMTGPDGTFVQALRMGAQLHSVRRQIYAIADPRPDPPERVRGDCPGVGYTLTDWGGIGRGTYWSDTFVRAFDAYDPEAVRDFLYALDHPLAATVSPARSGAAEHQ